MNVAVRCVSLPTIAATMGYGISKPLVPVGLVLECAGSRGLEG